MKNFKSSQAMLLILAGITIISASSLSVNEAMAFPHASLIIESEEEHVNPIRIVLGHTNEPAFSKLPGIHDGKHDQFHVLLYIQSNFYSIVFQKLSQQVISWH
jgi:hypothetical protein